MGIPGFVPLRNYTTLKRGGTKKGSRECFVPLRNYTTLKHPLRRWWWGESFVPLRNYTTLKPRCRHHSHDSRFVPLRNYTTLKQSAPTTDGCRRFVPLRNYTTLKPTSAPNWRTPLFCTSTKLHYSQTSNLKFASTSASTRRKSGYGPPEGNLIPCNFYFYFRIRTGQCQ